MLDRRILKTDYAVSYGSATLKSLQSEKVPELDLLVREAIQNSSDASLGQPGDCFTVGFTTGKFVPCEFNSFLSGIEDYMNGRFTGETADFMEIRDTKTSGLDGPIRKADICKDDHGNFFKLIYDTGKPQTQENAGGNWGFGKSVYYRVGIGIVIYYSRIKNGGSFESRLIITLVEDEGKLDPQGNDATILNQLEPSSAGKAWWGIKEKNDLLPVCDPEFINPLLEVFGLHPFKDDETGTSIIIPYIDTQALLDGIVPAEVDMRPDIKAHFVSTWASTLEDYLTLSIQKWYAPKIHNRKLREFCSHKWLLASVNNKPIRKDDLLPFFRLAQELYTTAIAKTYGIVYTSEWLPEIEAFPVNIQKYLEGGTTSGYVAVVKINNDKLNGSQAVLSPYDYVGRFEADGGLNEPIVMFARDPGMIIDYPIAGPWVKNISPPESKEDYLFAFYVPDTKKRLRNDLPASKYAGRMLGAYLRSCEASDHMEWNDPAKMKVVERIQKNTINQINANTAKNSHSEIEATASKLANKLGKKLLPRIGYGKKRAGGGESGGGSGGTRSKDLEFGLGEWTVSGSDLTLPFELRLMHGKKDVTLTVAIASEGGWITPDSWQADIGTAFPLDLIECEVNEFGSPLQETPWTGKLIATQKNPAISDELFDMEICRADNSGEFSSIKLHIHKLNASIKGLMVLRTNDKKYKLSVKAD